MKIFIKKVFDTSYFSFSGRELLGARCLSAGLPGDANSFPE